ncbi:TNF receptor-associated factor family protein [Glycine soja]|nr:TNF receptor-associated factor family protein [Glycine soja]
MDMPTIDVDLGPEKLEDEKQGGPLLHCDLCDTEVVHKLAQMFLPGLASACVDNTSGDLFKTPGSVAVDLRKEMIEYVTQRSESFVAESVILEGSPDGEVSDHPFDIISNLVDDFVSSKRNLFSRVSGWLLSEKREDKIDDFVQEMEMNGFWTLDRREIIAETLLKNVDFENSYHCNMSFNSAEELANHVDNCNFRTMICENEGCNSRFCAAHLKNHDSTCAFKIIACEQKCSDSIMRREMDRHCITVCPMKLVKCPFYVVGCRSAVAQCMIEKHCLDDVNSHLWHLLKGIYKKAYGDDLKRRVEQIVQASSSSRLAEARDVRSLNFIVKDIEAKLGPFKVSAVEKNNGETVTKNGQGEGGETDMNGREKSMKASDMVNSPDKAELSGMVNMNNAENTTKNEDRESVPLENKGFEEIAQTSNMTNLSDKTEVGLPNDEIKDDAASELKIKGNEESTQTQKEKLSNEEVSATDKGNEESTQIHKEKLSNEKVSATNEGSAENSIKSNYNEDNKFEVKDNEQSIQNSKMKTEGGSENNVKNKDVEDGDLKKSIQTSDV